MQHGPGNDYLTGLKNSAALRMDLRVRRSGCGVLLADLRGLGRVNESLGHLAGDAYLVLAARAMEGCAAPGGALYRAGGDELVLLAGQTGAEELERLARRAAERFAASLPEAGPRLPLSTGWAVFDPARDEDLADAYRRAWGELERRKALGYKE